MRRTLCVECGPDVSIDEDGCCTMCGNGAIGAWLDKHEHPAYELARLRPVYEAAKDAHLAVCDGLQECIETDDHDPNCTVAFRQVRLHQAMNTALAKERG